jgi:hypothetical protein
MDLIVGDLCNEVVVLPRTNALQRVIPSASGCFPSP